MRGKWTLVTRHDDFFTSLQYPLLYAALHYNTALLCTHHSDLVVYSSAL